MLAQAATGDRALTASWDFSADYLAMQPEKLMDVNHGDALGHQSSSIT
jgi:hypothetical protein